MALIAVAIALAANKPSLTLAAEAAASTEAVKVKMSAQARKLLNKHGMTLAGGILRKRGAKSGYDLANGSGAVYAIVNPKDKSSLAVALYDRGSRYSALSVIFSDSTAGVGISPLDEPEAVVAKLFPATL